MEKVLIKYSDFFNDDGGFTTIKSEFHKLGEDLIKEAKRIKGEINLFDVDNVDGISDTEKQIEELTKAFKKHGDAKEDLKKIETEYLKQLKKTNQSNDDQIDALVKLDKKLETHRGNLKEINVLVKLGVETGRDLNKERQQETIEIKKVQKEMRKHQKELIETNELSKKEQKLIQAKLVLQKTEIKTLDDVRERMSALRTVVQSLDLETQADQIKAFNSEINDLTETLGDNSDKFIQSKINVGNYEESIVNALKSSGLFSTQIGALDSVLEGVLGMFTKSADEIAEMEGALDSNSGALKRFAVSFGKLNKVMKASIIGAVLVSIVAIGSAFGDTRAGAIRMEKVMATLSNTWTLFSKRVGTAVTGLGDAIGLLLSGKFTKAGESWKKTMSELARGFDDTADAITKGLANIEKAYQLEDQVRRLNQEIGKMNGELQVTQSIADDATKSLRTQLEANKKALKLTEQIGKKQVEISTKELELANERVKQNIIANGIEVGNIDLSKTGVAFAQATLDLAQRRGSALELSNDLLGAQQDALSALTESENELALTTEENGKKKREIQRDIFEQNLDLLIDLIDTEKNISEQYVNDITKNFENRLNEFNRFIGVFRQNSQRELDEFTKEATNMGTPIEFSIEYKENGDFDVFANNTRLATDNIVQLNEQLQGIGMNEIDINRFREFMIETKNSVRDFRDLGKEIKLVGFNIKEMSANLTVSQDELKSLDALQTKINALNETAGGKMKDEDREKLVKQIEDLEKQREEIERASNDRRIQNRKDAIDAELATVEDGSERYYQLLQERIDLEKQLRENAIDSVLDKTKEANKEALKDYEKFGNEVKAVISQVADKVVELAQKRVETAEKAVERQNELVDLQQQRAQAGLENTLAFEQKALAKREADKIKQEKKQERLEKIRALYSSYANYSSQGDTNPIVKALRDFAILEAITASFGDGGVVEDKIDTKNRGIIRGRSHKGRQGGIPILVEGKEGIFSGREMDNLGKDNFYKMKDMASLGKVDSNFFSRQRETFIQSVPAGGMDPRVIGKLTEVQKAIEAKPVPSYDFRNLADGTMAIIETLSSKNGKKRNTFITKKPRI